MNIGEFKQAVRELRQALKQGEEAGSLVAQLGAPFETEVHEVGPSVFGDVLLRGDEEVLSLVAQLSALVQDLSDESPVYPELMVEVRLILDQYWAWVVKNVPCENWQKGEEVSPWLNLQRTLYQVKLLTNDYHHPVLYRALARQYLALGQSQLDVEKLLFMLMRCGRLMGYAEKGELSTYPLERLKTTIVDIERYRLCQEVEKLQAKTTILITVFYLLHRCFTVEQLALIPVLIYYRFLTTDEERRSELAIFISLCRDIPAWQAFFAQNNHYVDAKEFKQQECLRDLTTLIPTKRTILLSAVDKKCWIYSFIYQSRRLHPLDEKELLLYTIRLFRKEFVTLDDSSYSAALNFAAGVRRQINCLTEKEANLVHDALYTFCLHVYEEERRDDKRPSRLSLSGKTKCNAAEKKRQALAGCPIKYGFFEFIALKQGRLGALVDMFEGERSTQKLV